MKQLIFFPFYHIYSDIVKTALGLKDTRSIERFFKGSGIKVHDIGGKKCVTCEDLFYVTKPKTQIFRYKAQGKNAKKIDAMFPD
jgi:hypothetical protein